MTPPHMQFNLHVLSQARNVPIITLGTPGTHGVIVAGTHGIGVNTPSAAAVAAATVGFDGLLHNPKGGMFTIGT